MGGGLAEACGGGSVGRPRCVRILRIESLSVAELCGANPFDYLTALQRHAVEIARDPTAWMPWNYHAALGARAAAAAEITTG